LRKSFALCPGWPGTTVLPISTFQVKIKFFSKGFGMCAKAYAFSMQKNLGSISSVKNKQINVNTMMEFQQTTRGGPNLKFMG
jgi:hypothetical protein